MKEYGTLLMLLQPLDAVEISYLVEHSTGRKRRRPTVCAVLTFIADLVPKLFMTTATIINKLQ